MKYYILNFFFLSKIIQIFLKYFINSNNICTVMVVIIFWNKVLKLLLIKKRIFQYFG